MAMLVDGLIRHVLNVLGCAADACGEKYARPNQFCLVSKTREKFARTAAYARQTQALHHIRGDETAFIICSGRDRFFGVRSACKEVYTPLQDTPCFSAC